MNDNSDTFLIVASALIVTIIAAVLAFSLVGHGGGNLTLR